MKKNDFLDVICQPVKETINVSGIDVEVRGLAIGELEALRKPDASGKQREPLDITMDLIADCCFNPKTGEPLIPQERKSEIKNMNPQTFKLLNEAISRVNGFARGNSKATDTEDSSSD